MVLSLRIFFRKSLLLKPLTNLEVVVVIYFIIVVVIVVNNNEGLRYKQVFTNNMSNRLPITTTTTISINIATTIITIITQSNK